MDKSWIHHHTRGSVKYFDGIHDFIDVARRHAEVDGRSRCPCRRCKNRTYHQIEEVKQHLLRNGMDKGYTNWIYHGEARQSNNNVNIDANVSRENVHDEDGNVDNVFELLDNIQMGNFTNAPQQEDSPEVDVGGGSFDRLLNDAQCELWPGCEKYSKLSAILKLFHVKVTSRMSNKSFDMMLDAFKDMLPDNNVLPKSHYETKSLLRDLGLGYDCIHACKHDCVLFWRENASKENCPQCGESRYKPHEGKGKKIPQKVLRHFPLKSRLQRLFMSKDTALDMRWHKEKRVKETNELRHPADSKAWEDFDSKHSWFAADPRNVRVGLATDGFNPFGNMSNAYSMWPVMIVPYNLPPWICMKEPYIFMSLLIPGPTSPGNDIDVYMQPLVEELKELWRDGVMTYDAYSKCNFKMHAAMIWTISDFPAYAMVSGWMTKGYLACPICNKETCSCFLKHGRKICYLGSRMFLSLDHIFRNHHKQFNGKSEDKGPPKQLTGDDILEQLNLIPEVSFGKGPNKKKRTREEFELNWTKKSIFFELPYWKTILLRHNLDVMHIEKNICDSVLGTLLDIEGKTKDTFKSRLDLEAMGIRKELHLRRNGEKFEMPQARYTLSKNNKRQLCEWLKSVKFPDGYASNISRCVNVNNCKISGLKSHDSHVLLQRLLPIAIRGFLNSDICNTIAELGLFFKELCCRTVKVDVLEAMERDIAVILSKLEMIFPPSFFDIMVHLALHLPREAIIAGPAQYRWMYPIERFLHTLKLYVRNKARPEGSIAEAYVDDECLTFCSKFLGGIETRFNREERNSEGNYNNNWSTFYDLKQVVRPIGAQSLDILPRADIEMARLYVLQNCEDVLSYEEKHKVELERENPRNVSQRHAKEYSRWFETKIKEMRHHQKETTCDDLYSLACGPQCLVSRYSACIVNGIRFHTKEREQNRRTQNSGVLVKGEDQDYYGALTDIIELRYPLGRKIFLFKCDWFDVRIGTGVHKDTYFTSVNVASRAYKNQPFVLANQALQCFYVKDNKLQGTWEVVQDITSRSSFDVPEKEGETGVYDEMLNTTAYQESEPSIVDGVVEADLDMDPFPLNRDDLEGETLDAEMIQKCRGEAAINDDFWDVENDEALDIQYSSDEEPELMSEDDTDMDDM
ncbi:uncharacterized protein LOC132296251 [Cornus florida]|uniref:uncharacterized protein LOC132296251 n=1 Tax=Cornus florida TaxID=4283 RepID=UPI0028A260E8|nr:uncharacterized protein LOC132296251 [Cornus florida]